MNGVIELVPGSGNSKKNYRGTAKAQNALDTVVGKRRGVELVNMHEPFGGGQVNVSEQLDDKSGLESLRGVVTIDVLVQIAVERQKDTGFFNDLLLGKVTKKAGAKGERSGSDAVTPGVEILIFLIPQLSVVMCSQTEQFTADTISCWAVSFLAVSESSGKTTGMIQPRTPVIFSFGMSHMFGCAPAQRHNVGRTLHLIYSV